MTGFAGVTDLAITRSAVPPAVNSGTPVSYTLSVTNLGSETARMVEVEEVIRGSLAIDSYASLAGSVELAGPGRLLWSPGEVDPGATVEMTVQLLSTNEGQASLSAEVVSGSFDTDPVNNSNSAILSVTGGLPILFTAENQTILAERGEPVAFQVKFASPTPVTWQWYYGEKGDRSIPLPEANGPRLEIPVFHHDSSFWVLMTNEAGQFEAGPFFIKAAPDDTIYWNHFEDQDGFVVSMNDHPD